MTRSEKIAILKEMYHKYDFTSAEQNLLAEMWEAFRQINTLNQPDGWEG